MSFQINRMPRNCRKLSGNHLRFRFSLLSVSADGELVYSGDGEFDTSAVTAALSGQVTGLDGILDEKEVVVADFLLYELGVI